LKALNIPFKKVVLHGRVQCGGPEGEIVVAHGCRKRKKANMWRGRGNSSGSWPPAFLRSRDIGRKGTPGRHQHPLCRHEPPRFARQTEPPLYRLVS